MSTILPQTSNPEQEITLTSEKDIIYSGFKLHRLGITSIGTPTFEQWLECNAWTSKVNGSVHFWIGDLLNYGEKNYGEIYSQALSETDYEYGTLADDKWITSHIPFSLRSENLTRSHAKVISSLEPLEIETWCNYIKEKPITVSDLKKEILAEKKLKLGTPKLPEGKYDVIYADPPWEYDVDLATTRSPENHYPVMNLEELVKFGEKVKQISYDNCTLFMWTTAPKLNWVNDILEAWGFKYKTNLIWDKVKHNMGHYSSVRHEILVIAGKGNSGPKCDGVTIQSTDSVQVIEKTEKHSEKPQEFRYIIEKLYPDSKKIELFAREKHEGWDVWGNEV